MKTLKFKTNINCSGCVAAVTPALDGLKDIQHWEVDTASPNKILTINADESMAEARVVESLKQKGYRAEKL